MQTEYEHYSEQDLEQMIANAEKALMAKKESKRKDVLAQIKELASSIGVSVQITEPATKVSVKGSKVPPKYRNPHADNQTWSGRGMRPKWLQELLDQGHHIDEFKI